MERGSVPMIDPSQFYTLAMREAHVEQFILTMSALGPEHFERTQSRHIGPTYGIDPAFVRSIKAKHRNELSFSGEGK